ncbi:uncharacterized protein MONBRDRAFT_26883 [Monosiga brevicollis MX1]|uniref:Uncharacterized protein n=1 Tax=Monosiga brevicollis TaxID=81824 RepID=A9V3T6_MONBE|nr:uncharacterized protein MONBRDRAFT_26883 [Monosiga brevicollis MX1]EDQ87764.1 predicted protein [Monosiga brevicollis MX1]|eukprot:XP_001747297.1 hypothetical protein [Monosiga brevicollis MX1]
MVPPQSPSSPRSRAGTPTWEELQEECALASAVAASMQSSGLIQPSSIEHAPSAESEHQRAALETSSGRSTPDLADLLREAELEDRLRAAADVHVDLEGRPKPLPAVPDTRPRLSADELEHGGARADGAGFVVESTAARFWALDEALLNVLQHHVERVQASDAVSAAPVEQNPTAPEVPRSTQHKAILLQLGDALDMGIIPDGQVQLAASDIGNTLLRPGDMPSSFTLHNPLLRLGAKNMFAVPKPEPACSGRAENIHALINVNCTICSAHWYLFENSKGATTYAQRAWRYLSENALPFIGGCRDAHTHTQLLREPTIMHIASLARPSWQS